MRRGLAVAALLGLFLPGPKEGIAMSAGTARAVPRAAIPAIDAAAPALTETATFALG